MRIIRGIVLVFLATAFINVAYSKDIAQGTIEIGGDSSLSISSTDSKYSGGGSDDIDIRTIDLSALYYVSPNVGVGVLWNNLSAEVNDGFTKDEYSQNVFGPIVGYNMSIDPTTSFQFYAGIILFGSFEDKTNGFTNYEGDTSGHILGLTFKKFLTDSVSFNAGFSMLSLENDYDGGGSSDDDTTNLDAGLSVYF